MIKIRVVGLFALFVLFVRFEYAMDVAGDDEAEQRKTTISHGKQIAEHVVSIGALARRMDEAFRSLDQINVVLVRFDHRVEDLELYMRRLLADKMAASK